MRTLVLLLALLLVAPLAQAQDKELRPVAQIALLPLKPGPQDEVEALIRAYWKPYYQTQAPHAFGRDKVRAGRFDLDGDGQAELILLIDQEDWEAERGRPLVVAKWTDKGWLAVGWSWGDEDTVFVIDEAFLGWQTIDTGSQWLRWGGKEYQRVDKPT